MLIYLDLCLYTDINISLLIEWVTYCMLGYIRLDWVRFWLIQYTILGWTMGKFRAQGVHQTGQQSPDPSQQVICARSWGREPINFGVFWGPFLGLWRNSWALGLTVSTHGLCFWADTELMGSSAPKTARILSHGLWVFCQFMNRKVMLQFGIFLAPQVL